MKTFKLFGLVIIILSIILTSCKKEELETIPFDTSCSISTLTYSVRLANNTHPFITWTSGNCVVREIVWDGTLTGAALPTSITHSAITNIDLFTGTATPEIITTEITPGIYTNIYTGIELEDNGVNDNIILNGYYTDGAGTTHPIKFLFNSGEVFEATLSSHTFEPGINTMCWIELNPSYWFTSFSVSDFDSATPNGDGIIVISESENTVIYDIVEDALVNSTTTNGTIVFETL
ncbi:MAG: hypothetical protein L3J35_03850 [Bacteroidales bacterium]|nr:hypothetical protein [Bacteroidales bacterium]